MMTVSGTHAAIAIMGRADVTTMHWSTWNEDKKSSPTWLAVTTLGDRNFVRLAKTRNRLMLYVHMLNAAPGRSYDIQEQYELEHPLPERCWLKIGQQQDGRLAVVVCGLDKQIYFIRPERFRDQGTFSP